MVPQGYPLLAMVSGRYVWVIGWKEVANNQFRPLVVPHGSLSTNARLLEEGEQFSVFKESQLG